MERSYPWEFRAFEILWLNFVEIVITIFNMISTFSQIVLIPFNLDGIIPPVIESITKRIDDFGDAFADLVHRLDLFYVYILDILPCGKPPVYK